MPAPLYDLHNPRGVFIMRASLHTIERYLGGVDRWQVDGVRHYAYSHRTGLCHGSVTRATTPLGTETPE